STERGCGMDPVTVAARAFIRETARVWSPVRPADPATTLPLALQRARVLRMEAAPDDRGDLIKTLRLMEWAPENRWPLVLYDAPFTTEAAWCDGLCAKLHEDY